VTVAITTITRLAIAVVALLSTIYRAISTVLLWLTKLTGLWTRVAKLDLAGCRTPVVGVRILIVTRLVGVH
jgi:hypothetical protein